MTLSELRMTFCIVLGTRKMKCFKKSWIILMSHPPECVIMEEKDTMACTFAFGSVVDSFFFISVALPNVFFSDG